jgi:hypothetical protein
MTMALTQSYGRLNLLSAIDGPCRSGHFSSNAQDAANSICGGMAGLNRDGSRD